ncbi:MAG: hypothetical protein VX265_12970 [Myxococcota bacterium]|nr:hypothetical protein [Myxococcota bacterium]
MRARLRRLLTGPPPAPRPASVAAPPAPPPAPWHPLHSALRGPLHPLLHPAVADALASPDPTCILTPLAPGLFTLPVLSDPARALLMEETEHAARAAARGTLSLQAPNSMNEAGLQLSEIGLQGLSDALCSELVGALTKVFPELGPVSLGDPHGFTVSYGRGADRSLGFHADDATVTLNLCLTGDAEGAEVVFEGVRCLAHRQSHHRPEERVVWTPRAGEAVLHLGAHRHRTLPIARGGRTNLVLWCRDAARVDLGPCAPWCGEHQEP